MGKNKQTHVIVIGNEKGGSGKTTTSMHVIMCLVKLGYNVGSLDLDSRQQSLSRYLDNRKNFAETNELILPGSEHYFIPRALGKETIDEIEQDEHDRFMTKLNNFKGQKDYVIIDTPGSNTFLARLAHSYADSVITPINDSFIDFDLLAHVDSDGETITGPSVYSQMVWNARQLRAQAGFEPIDWIVVRNRMGAQNMVNKQKMEAAIAKLSRRIGFRTGPGFNERVIFRELFPRGLTLLDLRDLGVKGLNISNVAARQELRELIKSLNLPGVTVDF